MIEDKLDQIITLLQAQKGVNFTTLITAAMTGLAVFGGAWIQGRNQRKAIEIQQHEQRRTDENAAKKNRINRLSDERRQKQIEGIELCVKGWSKLKIAHPGPYSEEHYAEILSTIDMGILWAPKEIREYADVVLKTMKLAKGGEKTNEDFYHAVTDFWYKCNEVLTKLYDEEMRSVGL